MPNTLLKGHVSPETAYLVEDYPYGGLRCKMRYWLEYSKTFGVRLMSQTTNPRKGGIWNKPKASTYGRYGGVMFLDEKGHVQWSYLHEYMDAKEARAWYDENKDHAHPDCVQVARAYVTLHEARVARLAQQQPPVQA